MSQNTTKCYTVYTDGSYKSSIDAGGYGTIIKDGETLVAKLYQGYTNTTNNRMEIFGVLAALQYFKNPARLKIYSDSTYVVASLMNGYVQKWFDEKDTAKKNLDLWKEVLELFKYHNVTLIWVKGHSSNDGNERADLLAQHAATCMNLPQDIGYTQTFTFE